MILKPRKGFTFIVKFIDFFNPVIVLLSIAGLILEYTQYKEYVLYPNKIIDMVFVVDFLLRLISFPSGKYFFKAYGWVDFLASIPGFTAFMQFGQYFGLFKVMRIGRFFKIIRVLRFLRIFSFLKKMKGDSAFIQERIMKIGVTVVIVFVTGLGFTDYYLTETLTAFKKDNVQNIMDLSRNKVEKLAERTDGVVYYSDNAVLYDADGRTSQSYSDYAEKLNSLNKWYIEINFSENYADHDGNLIPVEGVMISADDIMLKHDNIMLILITSLIMILIILIFYIGYIFAKDMKIVQLINDSVDADDYWLLKEEAKKYSATDELTVEEGEDEIISLIKMAARLAEKADSASDAFAGMGSRMFADTGFTPDFAGAAVSGTGNISDLEDIEADEPFNPSVTDGNVISLEAFEKESGDSVYQDVSTGEVASSAEEYDSTKEEETGDLTDILPDLSGFSDSSDDVSGFIGIDSSADFSAEESKEIISENLEQKLEKIGKTVSEINMKLSSLEDIQEKALTEVARDAASRAVKITSKSIGEYIHKKLSGR